MSSQGRLDIKRVSLCPQVDVSHKQNAPWAVPATVGEGLQRQHPGFPVAGVYQVLGVYTGLSKETVSASFAPGM